MKKIFITLAILINGSYMIQIYAQEKAEVSVVDVIVLQESSKNIQNSRQIERPYNSVEQMPQFPGGEEALKNYIKESLQYPRIAQENGVQGQVIVRFIVKKDGNIEDIQVLRSLYPACDKEAIHLVESMPKWTPGMQNGKAVDVYQVIPVKFRQEEVIKQEE